MKAYFVIALHAGQTILFACIFGVGLQIPARAIIADPNPVEFTQPDGTKVTLRLRGDEFFHWLEDVNGFTVVLEKGWHVYARLDAQNRLVPTIWQAGNIDPRTVGL